jgi:hypothetical protein
MSNNQRLRRAKTVIYLFEPYGIRNAVGTLAKLAVIYGGLRFEAAETRPGR